MVIDITIAAMRMVAAILIAFPLCTNAQSRHAAIRYECGYSYDFNYTPVKITDVGNHSDNTILWYTDNNGKHVLTYQNGRIFDETMEELFCNSWLYKGFFVPFPTDENRVLYFDQAGCHLIDIIARSVRYKYCDIHIDNLKHIVVHHTDCDKLWLIDTKRNNQWTEYIITADGIIKVREILLKQEDYKYQLGGWRVNLSIDCQHYVLCSTVTNESKKKANEIFYGDFDRTTGIFTRTSSYDLGPDIAEMVQSVIIAPDNSRIYCLIFPKGLKMSILEFPIVDGVPQWDQQSTIIEKSHLFEYTSQFFYALDNKIYVIEGGDGCTSSLDIDNNGKTIYNVVLQRKNQYLHGSRTNQVVASWFSDLTCSSSDICHLAATPDVQFANSIVCYGDSIRIILPEGGPYTLTYSIDGRQSTTISNIASSTYTMPSTTGNCRIESISVGGCTFAPSKAIEAIVLPQLSAPVIIQDEN